MLEECVEDEDCDDGLFCNGEETCVNGECQNGIDVDCSGFDLCEIATCNNTPDDNPFTWDYFPGFTSICDEETDSCITRIINLTHTCDFGCGAECITEEDCPEKCTKTSHKLYPLTGCSDCSCEYDNYRCVPGKCGAECDEDTGCVCQDDYCDGTTLIDYPDYGRCGTSGSEGCLCQIDTGEGGDCEPILIPDAPECYTPECGNGILEEGEECDDGNNDNGDGCSAECEIEECEHDVGIRYSYGNSFGTGIAIKPEGGDWISETPAELTKTTDYIIKYYIDNKIENSTNNIHVVVELDGIVLADYNTSITVHHYKEVGLDVSGLELGSYDISVSVEKIDEIDCNLSDNYAEREITIIPPEPYCGNGIIEGEEECDDGNNENGDGCDENCMWEEIICYDDSDCGIPHCAGGPNYCGQNDNVYQYFWMPLCINPGEPDAYCSSETVPWLIQDCEFGCFNGVCLDP